MKKINKKQLGEYAVVGTWKNGNRALGGMISQYLSQSQKEAVNCAPNTPRLADFSGDEDVEFYVCKVKLTPIRRIFPQMKRVKLRGTEEKLIFNSNS